MRVFSQGAGGLIEEWCPHVMCAVERGGAECDKDEKNIEATNIASA